tara:strand:+ start:7686 stop:8966 length:1281 start_codon:yes stop_codon:yes gene_type:complete
MDKLDSLDLNIEKYSTYELREMLGLINSIDVMLIEKQIDNIKDGVINKSKFSLDKKSQIISFLTNCKEKIINENMNPLIKNPDTTFSHQSNYMIPNTPESISLIQNPNYISAGEAEINKGRGCEDFPAGYLNPINIKTYKRILNIDSRFRKEYYKTKSSDFTIELPDNFKNVVSMKFEDYQIPLSTWAVNDCNHCFKIQNVDKGSKPVYSIDLSNGNYYTEFTSAVFTLDNSLNQISNTINKNLLNLALANDLSFSLNPISGKSIFTNNGTDKFLLSFTGDCSLNTDFDSTPLPFKLGWMLGFRLGQYYIEPGKSLESEGIADFIYPKYLYISINDFNNSGSNEYVGTLAESVISNNIIGKINYGYHLIDDGVFNMGEGKLEISRYYYGPVNIKKLHIQLLNEYGDTIDLNNMDWSCALTLTMLYD